MAHYTLLRTYSATEQASYIAIIERALSSLPFSIAHPLDMLQKELELCNYDKAMSHAFDLIEISVQWAAMFMLARGTKHISDVTSSHLAVLQRIVEKIDNKRPLSLGDWVNDIFIPLSKVSEKIFPDDKIAKSITKHLFSSKGCTLLGNNVDKEPSIVKMRNDYRGHDTTLSPMLCKNVVYTLEYHILSILKALEPLCDGEYFSVNSDEKGVYESIHKGAKATVKSLRTKTNVEASHYYATIETSSGYATYDLFPLIYCDAKGYVYIFQTLGDDDITYVSSNINARRISHDKYNDHFDSLLQNIDKSFDISKEKNWAEIEYAMCEESRHYLERIYNEKKYNRELFVDHAHLSNILKEFYTGERTLLPLLGEAGQGKTNQLCYWTEEHILQGDGVLIFSSSDFAVMSLEDRLRRVFGYSVRRDIVKIIDMIHSRAVERGKRIYIFFDAINECLSYFNNSTTDGPLALYDAIFRLFIEPQYTQFKVVFTCRSYTWKSLFSNIIAAHSQYMHTGNDSTPTIVRGFNREELEQAYSMYQSLYQMKTPFAELSSMAKVRLKDPMVLKIASSNYLSKELPADIDSYASIALFNEMLEEINMAYAGQQQNNIILQLANIFYDSYLNEKAIDSISESELRTAYTQPESPLHNLARLIYKDNGTTVAYGELINRPDRPILRLVDVVGSTSKSLQFVYERFLEYVLAYVFIERHRQNKHTSISPSAYTESLQKAANNVVYMGAMRNALIIDLMQTNDYSTILTLIRDYSDNYLISTIVGDVCNTLIRENYEEKIFTLINFMVEENIENGTEVTQQLNDIIKKIDKGEANQAIIAQHRKLYDSLKPIIHLRKMALVNTFNGLLLTDYFEESLYKRDPMKIVWKLVCDPIKEIGNDACLYAYYLTNRQHTLEYTPLKRNLTEYIVGEMYAKIKSHALITNAIVRPLRKRTIVFLEAAVRISTLIMIDALLSQSDEGLKRVKAQLAQVQDIIRYITGNWTLIKILMPFFQIIMRTQITFQKIYVNNAIEYQCFWDDKVIPQCSDNGGWDRNSLREALSFLAYNVSDAETRTQLNHSFEDFRKKIIACYGTGDSFSYFVIERMLIVIGASNWPLVKELYEKELFKVCHESEWCDYSQMSLLYNLFHTGLNMPFNRELLDLYATEAKDWTERCRGEFIARNSAKANPKGKYKRNVLVWYAALYCTHSGDNNALAGDNRCVPIFYNLIDKAIAENDKELLFHLLENIAELVTDFGFIHTALALLYYTLANIDSQKLEHLDNVALERDGIYRNDTTSVIGNVLSTAKNYYPNEVDKFINSDIAGLSFPTISQYSQDILNYNPSGESLSDLLTHKFGKFLVWSLIYQSEINTFACNAVKEAIDAKSCFNWYDKSVRLAMNSLFGLNV